MKKLLSLGLVASLSLTGLVACGGNDAETPAETPSNGSAETTEKPATSGEKVEIKLWLDDDDYAAAIEPAIEAAYPNIDVVYEKVGAVDARTKLELDGPAGLGGDVFIQPHDGMSESILSNILLPLGSDLGNMIEERMLEGAVGTVKVDNTYYGIPLATESLALFYNKTLLEENGFEVATSFEQIKEQAAQYNDAATNKFLLRFQPGNSYDMHFFLTGAGFQLYGENHDDASQVNLNTPEVVAGLEFFKSMKEYLPVPYADLNWDTVHGEFIKGNVPYMISGPWSIAEAKQGAIDNEFEWGVTTIPTIKGVQPETFSGNIIACVSAYTQHPTEAKQVAEFLASEEGLQIMYDVQGKIPALKDASVIEGVTEDPYVA
ncbi:extracellular solute-binding protein, partial [Turicibacter sanguinis]|nr:extracellular solute-binding protein [Turicibacter sanguinis]MTP71270.1 extracellular solute-binding protein [Turicibacter sanguinis]